MDKLVDGTPFYKRLCFNLSSIALVVLLLYAGQAILVPFFFAVLLATLLLPFTIFLEKKGLHRIFAIVFSLSFSFIIIGSIIYFLVTQTANFFDDLPTIHARLDALSDVIQKWVRETFAITIRKQDQIVNDLKMNTGTGMLGATFVTITQLISYVVLLPVYAFLILYYRILIKKFLVNTFRDGREDEVKKILQEAQSVSQRYIAGLLIELTIVFGLNAIGFWILGIKYVLFLALLSALLNLIPYIGMLVANILCMLITLISSDVMRISDIIWVGMILLLVQFIDNNFLMPLVVGSKVRINSLVTIVGVLVGGALFGVPGMFLCIPGLAVLKVIFDRVKGLKPYGILLGDLKPARKVV
jgi:predicted PurR-regulated permease PerM